MNKCLITYNPTNGDYSLEGLKLISPKLKGFSPLEFTQAELRTEAIALTDKISIQGVQPKLSATISIKEGKFFIVEKRGTYIIKVQVPDREHMPENEDLTMKLAATIGIETPVHGLIKDKNGDLNYFIKRFDRYGQSSKYAVEDFAQLLEVSPDVKYESSTEALIDIVNQHCTFPALEMIKLFKRILFSFITGNEDMHLKNFSLITKEDKTYLAPAYDLLNTSIVMKQTKEELALPIMGSKARFKRKHFVDYLGIEKMKINPLIINSFIQEIESKKELWYSLIEKSFLSEIEKKEYISMIKVRLKRI